MAHHHFGRLADVWKHLVLCEVLSLEAPSRYAETHAGAAAYVLRPDDAERGYGVESFTRLAASAPALAESAYLSAVRPGLDGPEPTYRGSALLAMHLLGDAAEYLLCDPDPAGAADTTLSAAGMGVSRCTVLERDGLAAVSAWVGEEVRPTVVHVDPFDPTARVDGGPSALELAGRVADAGAGLVYWYGYDDPSRRGWPMGPLGELTAAPLWCGDVLVQGADGSAPGGDLGEATTPGTGFGVVLANVAAETQLVCAALGQALAEVYDGVPLPSGTPGRLDVQVIAA